MHEKYDKYWRSLEKMNMLLYVAIVLDPQNKLEFVNYCFNRMYASEEAEVMTKKMKEVVVELFNDYRIKLQPSQVEQVNDSNQLSQVTQATSEFSPIQNKKNAMKSDFKKYRIEIGCVEQKTKLDKYLSEDLDDDDDFHILDW